MAKSDGRPRMRLRLVKPRPVRPSRSRTSKSDTQRSTMSAIAGGLTTFSRSDTGNVSTDGGASSWLAEGHAEPLPLGRHALAVVRRGPAGSALYARTALGLRARGSVRRSLRSHALVITPPLIVISRSVGGRQAAGRASQRNSSDDRPAPPQTRSRRTSAGVRLPLSPSLDNGHYPGQVRAGWRSDRQGGKTASAGR